MLCFHQANTRRRLSFLHLFVSPRNVQQARLLFLLILILKTVILFDVYVLELAKHAFTSALSHETADALALLKCFLVGVFVFLVLMIIIFCDFIDPCQTAIQITTTFETISGYELLWTCLL